MSKDIVFLKVAGKQIVQVYDMIKDNRWQTAGYKTSAEGQDFLLIGGICSVQDSWNPFSIMSIIHFSQTTQM